MTRSRRAVLVVVTAATSFVACGDGEDSKVVTEIGVPSPDVPTVPAPAGLELPTCTAEPTREGVGRWRAISNTGAPAVAHYGTWTGKQMVIVNSIPGEPQSLDAYNPESDTWRTFPLPTDGSFARKAPLLGGTGDSVVIYGGRRWVDLSDRDLTDGWIVDLNSGVWTAMSTEGAPKLSWPFDSDHGLPRVFTVGPMLLFVPDEDVDGVAAATYDTVTGKWQRAAPPANAAYYGCHAPGWNGSKALCGAFPYVFEISADPLTVKTVPRLFHPDDSFTSFVGLGDVFFGWRQPPIGSSGYLAFIFDPARGMWGNPTISPAREYPVVSGPAGRAMIWGGVNVSLATGLGEGKWRNDGVVFNPTTSTWAPTTCVGAPPLRRFDDVVVRTSTGLILFGGNDIPNYLFDLAGEMN